MNQNLNSKASKARPLNEVFLPQIVNILNGNEEREPIEKCPIFHL